MRPIRKEGDYQAPLTEIATLMDDPMGSPAADRLDILTALVEAYEAARVPIEAPDPVSASLFMMEQKSLQRRDLEYAIGSRSRVADVLNRRRALTLPMIRALKPRSRYPRERADPALRDEWVRFARDCRPGPRPPYAAI